MPAKRTSNAAKKGGASRSRSARRVPRNSPSTVVGTVRGDIIGIVLVVLALALIATIVVPTTAVVSSALRDFLALSFGVGAPLVPLSLLAFAATFFVDGEEGVSGRVALGLALIVLAVLAMVSLNLTDATASPEEIFSPIAVRLTGGYVGSAVAYCLLELVGSVVGNIILAGLVVLGLRLLGGLFIQRCIDHAMLSSFREHEDYLLCCCLNRYIQHSRTSACNDSPPKSDMRSVFPVLHMKAVINKSRMKFFLHLHESHAFLHAYPPYIPLITMKFFLHLHESHAFLHAYPPYIPLITGECPYSVE